MWSAKIDGVDRSTGKDVYLLTARKGTNEQRPLTKSYKDFVELDTSLYAAKGSRSIALPEEYRLSGLLSSKILLGEYLEKLFALGVDSSADRILDGFFQGDAEGDRILSSISNGAPKDSVFSSLASLDSSSSARARSREPEVERPLSSFKLTSSLFPDSMSERDRSASRGRRDATPAPLSSRSSSLLTPAYDFSSTMRSSRESSLTRPRESSLTRPEFESTLPSFSSSIFERPRTPRREASPSIGLTLSRNSSNASLRSVTTLGDADRPESQKMPFSSRFSSSTFTAPTWDFSVPGPQKQASNGISTRSSAEVMQRSSAQNVGDIEAAEIDKELAKGLSGNGAQELPSAAEMDKALPGDASGDVVEKAVSSSPSSGAGIERNIAAANGRIAESGNRPSKGISSGSVYTFSGDAVAGVQEAAAPKPEAEAKELAAPKPEADNVLPRPKPGSTAEPVMEVSIATPAPTPRSPRSAWEKTGEENTSTVTVSSAQAPELEKKSPRSPGRSPRVTFDSSVHNAPQQLEPGLDLKNASHAELCEEVERIKATLQKIGPVLKEQQAAIKEHLSMRHEGLSTHYMAKRLQALQKFDIVGTDQQVLHINLEAAQTVFSEPGCLIQCDTDVRKAVKTGGGGCFGCFAGMCCAEKPPLLCSWTNLALADQVVCFGPKYPAKVVPISLDEWSQEVHVKRHAFIAATDPDLKVNVCCTAWKGVVGKKLYGTGLVFVSAAGAVFLKVLRAGDKIVVDSQCVVAWQSTCRLDTRTWTQGGCGCGRRLSENTLEGPGKLILQSMPFERTRDLYVQR